jgi:hypothetical protein
VSTACQLGKVLAGFHARFVGEHLRLDQDVRNVTLLGRSVLRLRWL